MLQSSAVVALCLKSILVVIGVPANAVIIARVLLGSAKSGRRLTRIEMLTINLCIVDLLILLGYNASIIAQMVTTQFQGSDGVCKALQFFLASCFTLCSFTLVGIALERVLRVYALNGTSRDERLRRAKLIIALSWILGLSVNVPHFFVYSTVKIGPSPTQCTTVFRANRLLHCYDLFMTRSQASKKAMLANISLNGTGAFSWTACVSEKNVWEDAIGVLYLLLLFWLPALMIALCNVAICVKISPTLKCLCCCLSASGSLQSSHTMRATQTARTIVVWRTVRLTLLYIVLWFPHNAMEVVRMTQPKWYFAHFSYIAFTTDLITVNAVINPFIYKINSGAGSRKSVVSKQADAKSTLLPDTISNLHSVKSRILRRNSREESL